jgi:hypothetical protein
VVIHLHAIVEAIALLGRDFQPSEAELRRARRTKADRFFWFDEVPGNLPVVIRSMMETLSQPPHRSQRRAS